MSPATRRLSSWQSAQRQIATILARLNRDPDLILAAAANPLLAIQELGYEVDPAVQQEFADRIRFGAENGVKLGALREQIFESAGRRFDLDFAEALANVLSSLTNSRKNAPTVTPVETAPVPFTMKADRPTDPLEKLRSAHPIMEPLLEYRRMDASTPRLATKELYDEIRQKRRELPITKLVAHLKANG